MSSLLPPSRKERELARQATNAVSQQVQLLAQQLGQTAHGMAQNLQKPAQQGVESVQATASRAASTIADRSRSAAEDVAGRAEQAKTALATPLPVQAPRAEDTIACAPFLHRYTMFITRVHAVHLLLHAHVRYETVTRVMCR